MMDILCLYCCGKQLGQRWIVAKIGQQVDVDPIPSQRHCHIDLSVVVTDGQRTSKIRWLARRRKLSLPIKCVWI